MLKMDRHSFGVHVSHLRAESLVDDHQTALSVTSRVSYLNFCLRMKVDYLSSLMK